MVTVLILAHFSLLLALLALLVLMVLIHTAHILRPNLDTLLLDLLGLPLEGQYPPPPHSPQPPPQHPQHFQPPPGPPGPPGPPHGYGQGFGAPPMPAPSMPSLGYAPGQVAPGDFRREADALRKAMKGFGTDEKALIQVLSKLDPLQVAAVRATYSSHIRRDLYSDIKSETSSYFRQGLLAIVDGPLMHDTASAREAVQGIGTKEWLLNDVLLGRSNADLNAIKLSYERTYRRSLERDVEGDLSFKTKSLFAHVLRAARHEENAPIDYRTIESEAQNIHGATAARMVNNADEVCSIFARSSNNELRALSQAFSARYHTSLEAHIEKEFSGHMKDALLHMLRTALDPAMRDAVNLEECMRGMGTKDERLVVRVVRVHWDRQHLENVKRAYQHKYKQDLVKRVRGETSGDYQRLLVAMLE
ncbi:hypothetical protein AN2427.2 [Aspergillus nidulans FGSC A4]|nr:hypothetical protein AN2427.2 [Aspergillus nidulans FGSC A4]|eukprot:XP_660031.1 hypothetical protein AN2427.2 [Aspergillus nidulans FGSC A4]